MPAYTGNMPVHQRIPAMCQCAGVCQQYASVQAYTSSMPVYPRIPAICQCASVHQQYASVLAHTSNMPVWALVENTAQKQKKTAPSSVQIVTSYAMKQHPSSFLFETQKYDADAGEDWQLADSQRGKKERGAATAPYICQPVGCRSIWQVRYWR